MICLAYAHEHMLNTKINNLDIFDWNGVVNTRITMIIVRKCSQNLCLVRMNIS